MCRERFRTRLRLIGMPSLARSCTIHRLPVVGSSSYKASNLAMIRSVDSRRGTGWSYGVD
jgi:hypothetical protein